MVDERRVSFEAYLHEIGCKYAQMQGAEAALDPCTRRQPDGNPSDPALRKVRPYLVKRGARLFSVEQSRGHLHVPYVQGQLHTLLPEHAGCETMRPAVLQEVVPVVVEGSDCEASNEAHLESAPQTLLPVQILAVAIGSLLARRTQWVGGGGGRPQLVYRARRTF